jgi:hypothetical protein
MDSKSFSEHLSQHRDEIAGMVKQTPRNYGMPPSDLV